MKKKRVLNIEQNNAFVRAWILDPSLSQNGEPIGGLQGSLKILQKLVREIKPDKIVICWDGPGGSRKRKEKNKNYKEGRTPPRLNWNSHMMSEKEQYDNKIWQMHRLTEYYDEMPVVQLLLENVEADDIISVVCQLDSLKGYQKCIVSSDKDFIQLLNDETILYRPIQKEILNEKKVVEKYGIHPTNFALARAVVGDKSDNLKGVSGIGLPTVAKRFSFLSGSKDYNITDLLAVCELQIKNESKIKAFHAVCDDIRLVSENYDMMQLYSPSISFRSKEIVKKAVENNNLSWKKTKFHTMMIKDGFGVFSWDTLIQTFNRIIADK